MRRAEELWEWLGEPLAIDFANTLRRSGWEHQELLNTGNDVVSWLQREPEQMPSLTPEMAHARLQELLRVRDDVFALLLAASHERSLPADALRRINARVRRWPVVGQLAARRSAPTLLVLGNPDPVEELLARVAAATVEISSVASSDLAFCDAPSCGQFFLRERRNQRWCGPGCGTRARVARHAAKDD